MKTNTKNEKVATTRNGLKIKSSIKAGAANLGSPGNHNQTQIRATLPIASG